ncbi:MAG: hypothetical protein HOJ79_10130 [Nitrospina sp.]|nr:hypothetical protein [Nitrospina sp.]MBT5550823.1 hypothetical protein [Nitrospina sp.]
MSILNITGPFILNLKPMNNQSRLKISILAFLILLISAPSQAFYIKKVMMGQFNNPVGWKKNYDPGKIIAGLLSQELTHGKRVQLVSLSGNMTGTMDSHNMSMRDNSNRSLDNKPAEWGTLDFEEMRSPDILFIQGKMNEQNKIGSMEKNIDMRPPWPTELGKVTQNASMTEVRGTVIKFIPDKNKTISADSEPSGSLKRENAELQVHIELVQNKTGRILFEKTFKAFSKMGKRHFSVEELNMKNGLESSSMKVALNHLKQEMGSFITDKLESVSMEGEVININKKAFKAQADGKKEFEEEILVNIGLANGVRIGDLFDVYAMSLGLQDPFSGNDLGDIYERVGVVQILHAWDGFSKAISLGGKNYKKGYLIRSTKSMGKSSSRTGKLIRQDEETVPWWEFRGVRSVN